MKNRERQRRNRRLKAGKDGPEKPWLNQEGYYDLTAYHGIERAMKSAAKTVNGISKDTVTRSKAKETRTPGAENPDLDAHDSIGCSR